MQSGGFLRDASIAAGHELGVFEALALGGPASRDEVAAAVGALAGRRRLGALLDVLAALGAIACERSTATATARFAAVADAPPWPSVERAGWGLLAEVIRRDRPLPIEAGDAVETERRYHHHLVNAGAAAAAELADAHLGTTSLLDLGSGAGAYSRAFLHARPGGRATLVDTASVLALATAWLGPLASRASFVEGDACAVDPGTGHGAALLANLLHLHAAPMCARLCAAAARAVAPGGVVVIKDLRVDDDRRGPLEGLLFALNMALYTESGDVHSTSQLRSWLAEAGLVEIVEHRLAATPDAIVMVGRRGGELERGVARPRAAGIAEAGSATERIAGELDAALARTADSAWRELVAADAIRPDAAAAGAPALAFPAALRQFLAAAVALERSEPGTGSAERAGHLVRHYTDAMPRMRVAQLAGTSEPGATLFHTPLDWDRLPRLGAAIDRLFAVLADAGVDATVPLGAASAEAFRARSSTLATLYERTHYGGFMPLLYGFPADLAYMHARGVAEHRDVLATIDRYLCAPVVHELCHFAPGRAAISPPHLDECIAGWLGVHVHRELAYPTGDHDDALHAAPWLSQVGQAIARAFGIANVVRAHAGGELAALPDSFVTAAARLGWDDWRARRTLHFLSDTFDPAPWVGLALTCGAVGPGAAGSDVPAGSPATLRSLAASSLAAVTLPDDPGFDRAIVEDGLRAMCLASAQVAGSFRTRTRLPDGPIAIDAVGCAVIASHRGELDPAPPRYWLPPAVAARIAARRWAGYELRLGSVTAIPEAAAAICEASPEVERGDFALSPRAT
jgi:SAM-dependent methyltransferase